MAITSTNNLRKGMKDTNGSTDVLDLQKALNGTGWYNLDLDGSYGGKTEAAVKDYQQRMGLKVDGVVGTNTWGALSGQSKATSPATTAPTFSYTPSDKVTQMNADAQQKYENKPGEWQGGTWMDTLNNIVSQIANREKFSYDLNGDMLYQQYKDQYTTQGKLAMMDTMGQVAAMNGGYGSSYAQAVGQQAYQGQLQKLNEVVPELYSLALEQYNREGQDMYDRAALLAQMEAQEYGIHRDEVSDFWTDLNYLTENARYMSETEYDRALQDFNIKYTSHRDAVSDDQWQKTFDEGVRQYNTSLAETKRQYDLSRQDKDKDDDEDDDDGDTVDDYYDQLLGAVATAKGAYSKQDYQTRQKNYNESVAAINDAYSSGKITKEQRDELLRIATPGSR